MKENHKHKKQSSKRKKQNLKQKKYDSKHKTHTKMVFILLAFVLIIAGAVTGKAAYDRSQAAQELPLPMTKVVTLERRNLANSISSSGKVTASNSKTVSSDLSGVTVESLRVQVGDKVHAGDVICTFDKTEIEQNLKDAQKNLNASKASQNIVVSAAERSLAQAEAGRNLDLERADADVAQAWNDYLRTLADLEAAEEQYEDAQVLLVETDGELAYWKEKLKNAEAGKAGFDNYSFQFETAATDLHSYVEVNGLGTLIELNDINFTNAYLPQTIASMKSMIDSLEISSDVKLQLHQRLGILEEYWRAYYGAQGYIQGSNDYRRVSEEMAEAQERVAHFEAKYAACEGEKNAAEAAMETAMSGVDTCLRNYEMQVRAKEDKIISNDNNIMTQTDSVNSARITAGTTGISEEASIRQYEKQLEDCTVTAPIDGTITEVGIVEGDCYAGAMIVKIENEAAYMISAEIDEYDILKIKEGQRVIIKTKGTGEEEFEGKVFEIAPTATTASSTNSSVTYTVQVSFDTSNVALKLGMTCILEIILDESQAAFAVPPSALRTDEEGKQYILVGKQEWNETEADASADGISFLAEDGQFVMMSTQKIYVATGLETDYFVEIKGDGLKEGMIVSVSENSMETMDPEEAVTDQGVMGGM